MNNLIENQEDDKENVKIENFYSIGGINNNGPSSKQKFFAEFIGTIILVFIACGSAVYTNIDLAASTFGGALVVTADVYMFQKLSGAHFNPVVSLVMHLIKKITFYELIYYCVAQFIGAFTGILLVALCRKGKFDMLASTSIGKSLKNLNDNNEIDAWCYISAFFCEVCITFILILVVLASTIEKNKYKNLTGLIIGFTLTMLIFTGFNISGASMNPARSLAPAFFEAVIGGNTTAIKQIWIYFFGPMAGSILGLLTFKLLY